MEKSEIQTVINELEMSISYVFIPWSNSRSFKEKHTYQDYNLNFLVTICHKGRKIITVDYSMGQGHCPSYSQKVSMRPTVDYVERIKRECETGFAQRDVEWKRIGGISIKIDIVDFFHSISMDCEIIQYKNFEEWAEVTGFNTDSRSDEKIYKMCLETALAMNAAIGTEGLEKLRLAYEDY